MDLAASLSEKFRARRDMFLRDLIARLPRRDGALRIVDVGGRSQYWRRVGLPFLREQEVKIDLVNLYASEFEQNDAESDVFNFVVADACKLDIADQAYDLYHSNSVIEHVGQWGNMMSFAREAQRVALAHYVQTPNYWFPVDPHFAKLPMQQWLPHPLRARLMMALPLATAGRAKDLDTAYKFVDSSILLTTAQMRTLFPQSEIRFERVMGLKKSIIAVSRGV
ncbi:MAG: class I SAM-dependent methyltransferase [Sphingopyxis sp.]|nr:class I SAM-dependent methyltransferase [Sphingopyxis sp.]